MVTTTILILGAVALSAAREALTLKSLTSGQCLVASDSAWPTLGSCTGNDTLILYVHGKQLRTKIRKCLAKETVETPETNISVPYLVPCAWNDVSQPKDKRFKLPLVNDQLKLIGQDYCLQEMENSSSPPHDLLFVPCESSNLYQKWTLAPVNTSTCRTPGELGFMEYSTKVDQNNTIFHFSWKKGLPENVSPTDNFTVKICLESYPAAVGEVVQCVTRNQWKKSKFSFSVPSLTSMCRRHFTVTYSNECGAGVENKSLMGCVGRKCAPVCNTEGSQPATVYPDM